MNNVIKRVWNKNTMVNIEDLQGMAFQAESGGHTFQISGIDGEGNTVALSGTPAGVMLRADGQDVTLTCSVSGGVVSATLPANAYSVPGRFGLTIFLTSDGQKTAIYAAVGTVGKTSSGTVAPPAGSDVVDLVNAIAAAVATIPASYTDLMASVAPTYSSSGLYAVGSYAWYNGKLYRCTTAITSGETWSSGHWTLANLGSDLVDLKSALNNNSQNITQQYLNSSGNAKYTLKEGISIQIASGNEVTNPGWYATDFIYLGENVDRIETDFYGGSTVNGYAFYDRDMTYISGGLVNTSGVKTIAKPTTPTKSYYIRLSQNSGGTYIKIVTTDSIIQLRSDTEKEFNQKSEEYHNLINTLYSEGNAKYTLIPDESVNVSTGEFVSNTGWHRTGYIEIPINASKISTDFYGGSTVNGYAWYDNNKNYISGNVINFSGSKILTPPANAKYIALSKNVEGSSVKFLSQNTIKNIVDIRENGGITITPSAWGANQSVQIATGEVVSNQGFYRFAMTEIPAGAKFLITNCTASSTANGFAFYNSAGAYISGALINFPDGWYTTIVIPKNAKYVAGCDNSGNYATRTLAFAFNNLYGRSLYSDGDSIAAGVGNNGRNYATIIAEKYGMRLNDQAVGGGTLATETYDFTDPTEPEHWISDSVPQHMTVGYDYAIIEGGFNDEGHNVTIGSLSSDPNVPLTATPDKTTMIGAMESIFQYIMKHYPKTKIFFLCVHRIYKYQTLPRYQGGQSYSVYLEKARECCARYGVEVIDVFNDSNLNTYIDIMSQRFMYDNDRTHPNEDGYQFFYVPQVEKHMLID